MKWEQLCESSIDDVIAWADDKPWCRDMSACQQDAEWHAEGDVWTHTKMVLRELPKLDSWTALDRDRQTVLVFTALFHDVAKPKTTAVDPETGHVVSPKHALKGEHMTRRILRELGCDLETRETIARMVRFHGRPAFLTEKENPTHEVVKLSCLIENRLLHLFAIADSRGRSTDSMTRPIDNLEYWKLVADDHDCYTKPFAFASDQARLSYCGKGNPTDADLLYVPHEENPYSVTMLCGLPGAGKDTWLAQNKSGLPVVSLDEIRREMKVDPTEDQGRVVQVAREKCREFLREKASFAFNATNLLRQTRQRWLSLFLDYHATIEIVYVEPTMRLLLAQNKGRKNDVPENVIRSLVKKVEPPTLLEGHRVNYVARS